MRALVLLPFVAVTVAQNISLSERVIFPRLDNFLDFSKDGHCREHYRLYRDHLENLTLWAHEMWEASAKYPTGHLRGNVFQMGDWNECITINGPYTTRYCLASIVANVPTPDPPRDPLSLYYSPFDIVLNKLHKNEEISVQSRDAFQMGICVPAICPLSDLEESLNEYLEKTEFLINISYTAKFNEKLCQTDADSKYFDNWDMAFCVILIVVVILVITSTLYDVCQREEEPSEKKPKQPSPSKNICLAFSIRRNFLDLPKTDDSNPALGILYGMKTVSIFMIIMDHRFGTFLSGPLMNYDYIERGYRDKVATIIFHGDLFVDSFFVLSGLLVTYGLLVQFDKKSMNPFFIILLRYVRLTPVYAFVILFWASMLNHLGSGPLWKLIVTPEVMDCRQNWWANLLYISNYVNDAHMCMVHSWYLPCDFHFFIVGIFILLILNKNRRVGLGILVALLILSVVIPFVLTVVYMRPALLQFYPPALTAPKTHPDFRLTYTKTHTRAVSYIVGMFAGYIYYRLKESPKHLSRISSHILTAGSFMVLMASIGTGGLFYDRYRDYNVIESGIYAGLHRLAWSAGTIGLLFSASYGYATFLKMVLSWSPWVPLSKLVYGAYLMHMSFQFRSVASTITPKYFTYFDVITLAIGDIVCAFLAALLLHLGIEAPVRKVFKELLLPARPRPKETQEHQTTNRNHDSRL